jgi:hypothetical protein
MRVAQAIVLEADLRRKLEQQSRGRSTAARVVLRGAPGLDFETWESIDIDEITPYSSGGPLLVFKHF